MERRSGLGRSLEDVLDSLAPTDPDPKAPGGPGRVLFEPEALEHQLDSLIGDIRELRERVHHLVALVPEVEDQPKKSEKSKKKHKAKKKHAKKKLAKKHKQKHRHSEPKAA